MTRPTLMELAALGLRAAGLSDKQAARNLGISHHTVKDRCERARRRLKARNTAHAVAIAVRAGML